MATADRGVLAGFDRHSAIGRTVPEVGGHRHWVAHRTATTDSDQSQFVIETLYGRMLVGSMSLQADPVSGLFSYSIGIDPLHRRCGYASDAVTVLLRNMFEQNRFRACELAVHSGNLGSLCLHGVIGFRETARVLDTEVSRGAIKYMVTMSITAAEFAAGRLVSCAAPPSLRGRHWRARRGRHWTVPQRSLLF